MINTLAKLIEKRGLQYVENFLNENVIITEKIDTFRLIFKKENDQIKLFKKDNTPINLIERVLTDIYEDAINEIPIITKNVNIPEEYYIGLYYTPVERPLRIPYSKIPKYILTDITFRDKNNKIISTVDNNLLKEWSSILCMGRPPIIFEGKLTEEQKKILIAYDTKQYTNEMVPFSKIVKKLFGSLYSKEDIIEGIIIKSKDKLCQVISYEFNILNEAYEKEGESRDFYDIIITDISNFLNNYDIPLLEADNKDELYLKIIYNIFNNYCKNKVIDENMDEKYLMPPQFGYNGKLNKKLINNAETLYWIEKSPIYEALFKVFVSSFRKPKKPHGLLTESIVNNFNNRVNLINNYINKFDYLNNLEEYNKQTINNEIDDIQQDNEKEKLIESYSKNIVIDALNKKRTLTNIDNMRVIASIQKTFEPKINNINKGKIFCAVYVTTFDPFTVAQMTNVKRIFEMWKCPIILMGISNKHKIDGKNFHISDDLIISQMQVLVNDNKEFIHSYKLLSSFKLREIFKYCRELEYEPIVIITDENKKSDICIQLFFEEEIMGGKLNVDEKFNIGELKNEDRLLVFRAIEDNNYSLFKELTPLSIHNLMEKIFSEYRLWSGQILKIVID